MSVTATVVTILIAVDGGVDATASVVTANPTETVFALDCFAGPGDTTCSPAPEGVTSLRLTEAGSKYFINAVFLGSTASGLVLSISKARRHSVFAEHPLTAFTSAANPYTWNALASLKPLAPTSVSRG